MNIVLPAPSNQIKVTFIIILPFNLVHLYFFPFHIEIEGKGGSIIGGGAKGMLAPPLKLRGLIEASLLGIKVQKRKHRYYTFVQKFTAAMHAPRSQ